MHLKHNSRNDNTFKPKTNKNAHMKHNSTNNNILNPKERTRILSITQQTTIY